MSGQPVIDGRQWEAWGHSETPGLLLQSPVKKWIANRNRMNRYVRDLKRIYKGRINADYITSVEVTEEDAEIARTIAGQMVKLAQRLMKA